MKELVWELFFLQVEISTFMPFADFVKGKEPANFEGVDASAIQLKL